MTLRFSVPSLVVAVIQPCGFSPPSRRISALRMPSFRTFSCSTWTRVLSGRRPTSGDLRSHSERINGGLSPIIVAQYGCAPLTLPPDVAAPAPYILLRSGTPDAAAAAGGHATPSKLSDRPTGAVIGMPSSVLSASDSHLCESAIQNRNGILSAKMYTHTNPPPADFNMHPSTVCRLFLSSLPAFKNSA